MGEKISNKKLAHAFISIAIMIIALFLPAIGPITKLGMQVIGIFVGLIWGWMNCGLLWPSLAGLCALGFTSAYANPQASLAAGLTHPTVIAMMASFLIIGFINSSNLMGVVINWIITRKFLVGKPWLFVLFLFSMEFICATIFHPAVLIMLFFSMIKSISEEAGYTKEDLFPVYMMLGIGIVAGNGTCWAPFMPNALFMHGLFRSSLGGTTLTTFQYMMNFTLPLFMVHIIYVLVGKFILRVDMTKFLNAAEQIREKNLTGGKTTLTNEQKQSVIVLIFFVLGLAIPAILPKSWPIVSTLNQLGVVGISMILVIALLVLRTKEGTSITDFRTMITSGMQWDMIFLTAGIMIVSGALTSAETGLTAALAALMTPIFQNYSIIFVCLIVGVILLFLSQVSMNMVLQMTFAPMLAPVLASFGYNPLIMVMVVYYGTMLAMMAPSGSLMAAMVFSETKWVINKNIYKCCIPWVIITFAFFMLISFVLPPVFGQNFQP